MSLLLQSTIHLNQLLLRHLAILSHELLLQLLLLHLHLLHLLHLHLLLPIAPLSLHLGFSLSPLNVSLLKLLGHSHIVDFLLSHTILVLSSHLHSRKGCNHICLVFFLFIVFICRFLGCHSILNIFGIGSLWVGHIEEHLEENGLVLACLDVQLFDDSQLSVWEGFLCLYNTTRFKTNN